MRLWGVSPPLNLTCFAATIETALKCITERVFYVKDGTGELVEPPAPKPGVFGNRLSYILEHFRNERSIYTAPLTKEQFLGTYVGRKRTIYENAFRSLLIKPLNADDAKIKFFIKSEKLVNKPNKELVPRGISPRSPRYNAHLGPYIKKVEKVIYKDINKLFGQITICKGLNSRQRGRALRANWDMFDKPVAIGIDASRFDQHVSEQALKWEHSVYCTYFRHHPELEALLRRQLDNRFVCYLQNHKIEFRRKGMRCSGDMNTSLGNCLLMSSMVHSYCRGRFTKFQLVNDGDDCVLFIESKELHKVATLHEFMTDFGFNIKIEEPQTIFEKVEFCQTQPVWTGEEWIMVRNPTIAMAKDTTTHYDIKDTSGYRKWLRDVGMCGMSLTGGIPVMQDYYNLLIEAGLERKNKPERMPETGMEFLARGMNREYREPTVEARVSYWRAFGLCPNRQVQYEKWLRSQKLNPDQLVKFPYIPTEAR